MIERQQIQHFLAMCRHLNFSRAARECHISQPALTKSIRKLEATLGGDLFRREGSLTHVTDLAKAVSGHLQTIYEHERMAIRAAQDYLRMERSVVEIGILVTIGPQRFAHILQDFGNRFPGVEMRIAEGRLEPLAEKLMAGEIDVAILSKAMNFDERIDLVPLYKEQFVVIFKPGHRFEALNGVTLADVLQEPYLDRLACEFRNAMLAICEDRSLSISCQHRSEREDWIQGLVAANLGVALLPEFSVAAHGLKTRPLIDPPLKREIVLATVAGRRFSPPVAELLKSVKRVRWQ